MRIDIKTLVERILDHAGFHRGLDFPKLPALIRQLQHSPTTSDVKLDEDVKSFVHDSSRDFDDATMRDVCRSLVTNPEFHLENEGDQLGLEVTLQLFDTANLDKVFEDLRLVPSENRVWIALTGHEIDYRQTKREEMDLLMRIAAAGEKGIHLNQLQSDTKRHQRAIGLCLGALERQGHIVRTGQEKGSVTLQWNFHIRFRDVAAIFVAPGATPAPVKLRTLSTFAPQYVGQPLPFPAHARRQAVTVPPRYDPEDRAYRSMSVSRPYSSIRGTSVGEVAPGLRPPKTRATLPDPPNITEFYRSFVGPPPDRTANEDHAPPFVSSTHFDRHLTQPDIGLKTPPASRWEESHDSTFSLGSNRFVPFPQLNERGGSYAANPHNLVRTSYHDLSPHAELPTQSALSTTSFPAFGSPYTPPRPSPLAIVPTGNQSAPRSSVYAGEEKRNADAAQLPSEQYGTNKRPRLDLPTAPMFEVKTWKESTANAPGHDDYDNLYMKRQLELRDVGAYIFRPLRYAGDTGYKQGRQRKKIVVVIKSNGLTKMDWFRDCPEEQRFLQTESQDKIPYISPSKKETPSSILIVKSARLQGLEWFVDCPEDDKLSRDAPQHRTRRIEIPYERNPSVDALHPAAQGASFSGVGRGSQYASANISSPSLRGRFAPIPQTYEHAPLGLAVFEHQTQAGRANHLVQVTTSTTAIEASTGQTNHAFHSAVENQSTRIEKATSKHHEALLPQSITALPTQAYQPSLATEASNIEPDEPSTMGHMLTSQNKPASAVPASLPLGLETLQGSSSTNPPVTPSRRSSEIRGAISAGDPSSVTKLPTRAQKREMLLDYVTKAQGAFPDDGVLWYPYATEVRKTRDALPHRNALSRFVDAMIDEGFLKRIEFSFVASNGEKTTKHVVFLPKLNENSPAVRNCKTMIESCHPAMYIPDVVEVDLNIETGLRIRQAVRGSHAKSHPTADAQTTGAETSIRQSTAPLSTTPLQSMSHAQLDVNVELSDSIADEQSTPMNGVTAVTEHRSGMSQAAHASTSDQTLLPSSTPYLYQDYQIQDIDAADVPNEEQLSLQYVFQIDPYVHDRFAAPTGSAKGRRPAIAHVTSKTPQANTTDKPRSQSSGTRTKQLVQASSRVTPASQSAKPRTFSLNLPKTGARDASAHYSLSQKRQQKRTVRRESSEIITAPLPMWTKIPSQLIWIEDELTKDATVQDALNEGYLQQEHAENHAARAEGLKHDLNNPSAWITSFDRLCQPNLSGEPGVRLCVTLSDPSQRFYPENGTFSADFSVVRSTRPTLTINTRIQRYFENDMPQSLEDILKGGMKKKRIDSVASDFDRYVGAVQAWETRNESTLTSKSLMVPRFINHYVPEIAEESRLSTSLTPKRSGSFKPTPASASGSSVNSSARRPTHVEVPTRNTPQIPPTSGTVLSSTIQSSPPRHSNRKHVPSQKLKQLKEAENVLDRLVSPLSGVGQRVTSFSQTPRSHTTPATQSQAGNDGKFSTGAHGLANPSIRSSKGPGANGPNDDDASGNEDGDCPSNMRSGGDPQTRQANDRFLVTLIVVRTLFESSSNGTIVWGVVCKVYPDLTVGTLKSRWSYMQKAHKQLIERLQAAFEEQYLSAYEQDQVPRLNYREPESFDIEGTIQWALNKFHSMSLISKPLPPPTPAPKVPIAQDARPLPGIKAPSVQGIARLPSTRQKLDEDFEMRPIVTKSSRSNTDALWNHISKESSRREALQALNYAEVFEPSIKRQKTSHTNGTHEDDDIAVAITLVRANSLTPSAIYDPALAENRLGTVSSESLQRAIAHLRDRGIIQTRTRVSGKVSANSSSTNVILTNPPDTDLRTYILDPSFLALFNDNSTWSPSTLRAAASYKIELDAAFGPTLDGVLMLPVHPSEGQTICLFQLNALRQIISTPVIDPEAIKKMMQTGKMETHMNPRMSMKADTQLYVAGLGPLSATVLQVPAPHLSLSNGASTVAEGGLDEKRIPLWYSITDTLLGPVWEQFVCMVLQIIVTRGSTTEADIVKALKSKVEVWDVQLVVGWMVDRGVVRRDAEDGRIRPREWWWGVFGVGDVVDEDVDKGKGKGKMRAE